MSSPVGNRITDNALSADDGVALITRATAKIGTQFGWHPVDERVLFSGVYYDSAKVGSFITRVTNDNGEYAVLKIQLRPMLFDEGFIIRHVQGQIKTDRIRLPKILSDEPWSKERGYGYLIFEDLSHLPHLWATRPDEAAFTRHQDFLDEFMHRVLPITPYLPVPQVSPQEKYRESFDHFLAIATASAYHHVDFREIDKMKDKYLGILQNIVFDDFHFTHGHLSGHEIVYDQKNDSFILFSNLLWSFRAANYELIFPIWVDLMGIRDIHVTKEDLFTSIQRWIQLWDEVEGVNLKEKQIFWFGILERSMMTVMLDLGSSEWKTSEIREKQSLLNAWTELFYRVLKEKF